MWKKNNKPLHNLFLVIPSLGHRGFFNWMADEPYIKFDIKGTVYFGELTFYHFDGMERFEPDSFDQLCGSWLKFPQKEVLFN